MINLYLNNQIRIEGMPPQYLAKVKNTLTLNNPAYHLMKAMKKSVWNIPRHIVYWENCGNEDLYIPRGSYGRLLRFVEATGLEYKVHNGLLRKPLVGIKLAPIELRDYQTPILARFMANMPTEGVITMTTGSGKTIVALEIIRRLGLTATILVEKNNLLRQFQEEMRTHWNYSAGIVNGEEKNIKDITVATFQTLMGNEKLLKELADKTSVIIIDEVQGITSKKRQEVLRAFKPSHLYGITATPERGTDGQTDAIFFIAGEEIENYVGEQMKPEVELRETKTDVPVYANYQEMIEEMVDNDQRNEMIKGVVYLELLAGKKVLVLTKRIQHYKNIQEKLGNLSGCYFLDSKNPDKDEILIQMKKGFLDFNAIFGTTSLLSVGVDIPALDTVVLACDIKSSILTTQSVGRVMRLFEGKPQPKVIDLIDTNNYILWKQARSRIAVYKKHGWKITYTGNDYRINRLI